MTDNSCSRVQLLFIGIAGVGLGCLLVTVLAVNRAVYDYSPAWSPAGKAIAFVCYKPAVEIDPAQIIEQRRYYGDIPYKPKYSEICAMAPDGSELRRLTNNDAQDYDPVWSPDGARLAFISDRDGASHLYIMSAEGSQQHPVSAIGGHPAWFPDGRKIAISTRSRIYILDLVTGLEEELLNDKADYAAWSPTGEAIAFIVKTQDRCAVRIVRVGGDEVVQLAPSCRRLAWSPDGSHLAFAGPQSDSKKSILSVLDLRTDKTLPLTNDGQWIGDGLAWTPEGDRVFYPADGEIFMAKADGSGWSQITNLGGSVLDFSGDHNLAISPDGRQIAFVRGEGTDAKVDKATIWRINSNGSSLLRLSP